MGIDPSHPFSHQTALFDKAKHRPVVQDDQARQRIKQTKSGATLREIPAGELADHERMNGDLVFLQEAGQCPIRAAEMIHPDGGIDEDHFSGAVRRRGMGLRFGA